MTGCEPHEAQQRCGVTAGSTPRTVGRWMAGHAGSPSVVTDVVADRAAWLTGQSSWRTSALSPTQHRVLEDLAERGWTTVGVGFPWTEAASSGEFRRTPVLPASVRNTVQGLAARPGSSFGADVARHLQPLLDVTTRRLVLLCGSAGARMVTAARAEARVPPGVVVDVVGVGPVGALPPSDDVWRVRVVRGSRDLLSVVGCRTPSDRVVPGGHLRAATSEAARAVLRDLVGPAGGGAETPRECAEPPRGRAETPRDGGVTG